MGAYVPGGGGGPPPRAPAPAPAPRHIPAAVFLIFDNAPKVAAVATKIRDFNAVLAASPDSAALALTPEAAGAPLEGLLQR